MKFLFTFVLTASCIQPAFFTPTGWLHDSQFCLSDEPSQVITLSSSGEGSSISMSMLKKGNSYPTGSACSLTVNASESQLLMITFDVIDTRPCKQDNITVETESSNSTLCGDHKCPNSDCPEFSFHDIPEATIHFQSSKDDGPDVHKTGFHGTITAYTLMDAKSKSCPGDDRFKCGNNRCIWDGLHCDGHNHCGDNSDEPPGCAKTVWGVLVIVLGVVAVCFFLPLFCYLAVWGPRRKVPIRVMGNTFFGNKSNSGIQDEEAVPILAGQPLHGSTPGETFTFYYGAASTNNPRC